MRSLEEVAIRALASLGLEGWLMREATNACAHTG
jgi:hypothetical protein